MTDEQVNPAYRIPVSYIDKSREYYLAQEYGNPYRWAYHTGAPFTPLPRPLSECRVGIVTTATPLRPGQRTDDDAETRAPEGVYAAPVDPPPGAMYTERRFWDKEATHTNDVESFLPIRRLQEFVEAGRIGSLSPRFYGVPTDYSQRRTQEADAPEVLRLCREDNVDVALLAPL